ncbi:MAG: terminase family protein [Ideonella sp.]|nr:terminase family protein [Ideonella sp.]
MGRVEQRLVEIPYKPREAFKQFHHRKQRFAVNVCHRRAGKTVAAVNDLIRDALTCPLERPRVYYIAPTYGAAKRVAWDYAKHYSRAEDQSRFNETELRIDYPNGGRLQLVGADNPDSLRGIYADGVVLDEFAFMGGDVWTKIIRPALSDRQGRATFISSVNGRNEFYRLFKAAEGQPEEWFSMNLKADTSGLIDQRELRSLKRDMPDEDYRQEYLNDFDVAAKGSYYGRLLTQAEEDGRICGVPYDGAAMVDTAWDLGYGDSTAIWFLQEVGREIHAIDYYEASGRELSHYASVLQQKGYAYRDHILPHDAEAKRLEAGGKSIVDQLHGLGLRSRIAPNITVDAGISAVRTMLPRMWFDAKKCADGVEKLRQYRSEYDEKRQVLSNRPLHDFSSHCADALRMYAVSHRSSAAGKKPPAVRQAWIV